MDQYLPRLGLLILGALFASGSFVASALLAPHKRPSDAKLAPYECGIVPEFEQPQRFPVRFYLVAMIFVIFDIEVVFMYPSAPTRACTTLLAPLEPAPVLAFRSCMSLLLLH